ncbi:MAG: hypothetical protein HFJ87_03105 [Muribaculaceae bacterium]|nr:hypothetical protein [Muribaculaceae bacterium]
MDIENLASPNSPYVWAFQGENALGVSGIYTSRETAELFIRKHSLSGILQKIPLNTSIYEWSIAMGYFVPSKEYMKSTGFIQQFSSAYLEHYHFRDGKII